MNVQILSTETIKPSAQTPHRLANFQLSFLDQICAPFYIPLTLFYSTKFDYPNISKTHAHLKNSLSETLKVYYPLAGRIQNHSFIDCNDDGVLYTEAKANFALSDFLQNPDLDFLNKFLPCRTNILESGFEAQISIQVTILDYGGLVIGACVYHRVADMATMTSFLKTWANFSYGIIHNEEELSSQDLSLGASLFPQLSSLPENFTINNNKGYFYESDSVTKRFVFDAKAINTLRAKATSENVPKPSRIEALTCFICERLIERFKRRKDTPTTLMISHAMNIRKRLQQPLPNSAFGNLTWFAVVFYSSTELGMELSDYVELLREAFQGINGESLSALEGENVICALSEYHEMIEQSDEVKGYKFTSWCNMGVYDLDFGWGKPAWVAHMGSTATGHRAKHQFLFLEGKSDGEIELWMLFSEEETAMLENDPEFVAYATPNPSILFQS